MLKLRWETNFKETEIGEIPRDWEIRELKDIAKIESGGNAPQEEKYFLNAKYPFIRVKHLNTDKYISDYDLINEEAVRDYNLKLFEKNTIVFAKSGESINLGKYNIIPFDAYIVNHLAVIKNIQNLSEIDFLFYVLIAFDRFVEKDIAGTTLPYLKITDIEKKKIFYPPLPEQSRIATVLSWFDDLIENKRRQNEILEKTAMAIFKSWFIDFELFRACPERERRNYEFVYNEELGREIPKGWEVKRLGEVVKTQYGVTISGENFGEIKLLRITDINKTFVIDWDNVPYCNLDEKMFYKSNLSDKDVVISRIADIGKVAIIEDPPKSVFASYLIRLKIKSDSNIKPYYFYYWLKSEVYQEYILGAGEGSTRENTNAEVIKDGPILIPDISVLQKFEKLACDLRSKIILNQKQIMTLRKIRDTLLPLLVFGKLRVEEI
jgi:type I restriction enzyme S subunit